MRAVTFGTTAVAVGEVQHRGCSEHTDVDAHTAHSHTRKQDTTRELEDTPEQGTAEEIEENHS